MFILLWKIWCSYTCYFYNVSQCCKQYFSTRNTYSYFCE